MVLGIDTSILPNVRLICSVAYKEPWTHFTRTIDEYILYIVKSGELHIQEDGNEYTLEKGDLLFLRPNIIHSGTQASCCHYYYIHFKHPNIQVIHENSDTSLAELLVQNRKASLISDFLSYGSPGNRMCYIPNHYHLKNDLEILHFIKEVKDDYFSMLENYKELVACKILEMVIKISREYVSTEIENENMNFPKIFYKVQSLVGYLNTEYPGKITSHEIESRFESNYDYLNRIFHKTMGHSIFNYLNIVRINRAKELIETTPIKFSEIGYLVGIDDPYYFSKLFKKYTGFTTTQYYRLKNNVAP